MNLFDVFVVIEIDMSENLFEQSIKWFFSRLLQCSEFEKAGAFIGTTPSDVVEASDITFSCVANPQVAKEVSIR